MDLFPSQIFGRAGRDGFVPPPRRRFPKSPLFTPNLPCSASAEAPPAFPRALFRPLAVAAAWPAEGPDESTLDSARPDAAPPDSDRAEPAAGTAAAPGSPEARPAAAEERHPQTEPKQAGALGAEPLRRGVQRLEWISRSPSPSFQDPAPDGAAGAVVSAFRAPAGREAAPASRRAKAKPSESCRRRAEPEAAEPCRAAEWAPPRPEAVGKQTWTVNAEDSVERLLPEAAPLEEPRRDEAPEPEDAPSVFTCIECSIYFRRREHLLEHTLQHNRGAPRGADAPAGHRRLCCAECGWAFAEPAALERHRRLHQESREKIIEEIQKLNEFPDEGREARLQCPKCVFGTNSSKTFVQHAKMHVKERKEHAGRSSGLFGELRDGAGLYKPFRADELPAAPAGKAPSACVLCGFPAPDERVLKEHLRFAHSHFSWQPDGFEDDANQPGTSRDSYGRFADAEAFGKTEKGFSERLFPPPCREGPSLYEPAAPAFGSGQPRSDKSDAVGKKEPQGFHHARKAAPFSAPHQSLALAGFSSPKAFLQPPRRRAAAQQPEGDDGDGLRGHPGEPWHGRAAVAVPRAALELKRSFGAALRDVDPAAASEEQRRQLRTTVPVVVLEELSGRRGAGKRPRGKALKRKAATAAVAAAARELLPEEPLPLDVLLLEAPLEGPLELEELLGSEAAMLRNEERKCPYCPDRFHNGIGLANHVRGHLNRVGVSYNVRHFISAEEVKAIEQKFSFQKKKKKGSW